MNPRSREKRCQPFLYDSPGTLERGTQGHFLRKREGSRLSHQPLLLHLLARWNVEDMHVPESVERTRTTEVLVGSVATRRVIGPRVGTLTDGTEVGGGYTCNQVGAVVLNTTNEVPTMTGSAGHLMTRIDEKDTFLLPPSFILKDSIAVIKKNI